MAVVAALHLVVTNIAFPGLLPISEWIEVNFADTAAGLSLLIVSLVVLAYALAPFSPLVRDFLDGGLMPDVLHNWLRQDRRRGWRSAQAKLQSARDDRGRFARMQREDLPRFWSAAKAGDELGRVTDERSIDSACAAIANWRAEIEQGRLPDGAVAKDAADGLCQALSSNASNLPASHADATASAKLDGAKRDLIDLIADAYREAEYHFTRIAAKYYRFDLYPTRVGDARWAAERYSEDAYGVDFDVIWSRIQLLLKKDENTEFLQRLEDTRSQVDYAVMSLALAVTIPLLWLPMLLVTATTPWLFLTIGLLSPVVLSFLYESVVQSQVVFGEVVRVAIDKYRLDVLTKIMRQPMPATLAAERLLWRRLKSASEPGNQVDLSYRHPE